MQMHLKKFTIFGILAPRFALWAKVKFEFIKLRPLNFTASV